MRDLKTVLRFLRTGLYVALWCLGTTWLGVRVLRQLGALCLRWGQITTEVRLCPRGHEVPVYGLWECACGSRMEGWAFSPCGICHETAAYVPCKICGLPVRNPFLL